MRSLLFSILLLISAAANAEIQTIAIPGDGWTVSFDLPETITLVEKPSSGKYYSVGSGLRFNLSLYVGVPMCRGVTTPTEAYECMRPKFNAFPGLVEQTLTVYSRATSVQVSYIQHVNVNDVDFKMVHTHVLFVKNGLWCDLHASAVKPNYFEMAALFRLGDSLEAR